jgi:hypothetical protein
MSPLADPAWYERARAQGAQIQRFGQEAECTGLPGQRHDAGGENAEPGVVLQIAGSGRRRRPPRVLPPISWTAWMMEISSPLTGTEPATRLWRCARALPRCFAMRSWRMRSARLSEQVTTVT